MDHLNGFLRERVERGDGFGVGLKGALRNDERGEFAGDVDVRPFEGAILHGAETGATGGRDGDGTAGERGAVVAVAHIAKALEIGDVSKGNLADVHLLIVGEGYG